MITNEEIIQIIFQVFPNFEKKKFLANQVKIILKAINVYFFDENYENMLNTMKLNKYRNIKAIIISIFYYLKPENFIKFKNFKSLEFEEMTNIRREFLRVIPNNNKFIAEVSNKIGLNDKQYLNNFIRLFIPSLMKISNKLYVNWINVQPISFPEVQETKNFQNTVTSIGKYRDDIEDFKKEKDLKEYIFQNRLYIGDIYNVIRNFLYERIKMNKLMIFYYVEDNKLVQYYDKLKTFTDKDIYYEYIDYRFLPQKEKENFQKFVTFLSNLTYNNDPNKSFSEDDMKLYFGIYYFNQIPFAKIEDKDKKLFKDLKKQLYNTEDEDEEDKKIRTFYARNVDNKKLNQIYNTYINNPIYIAEYYKYIQQQIIGYRKTIYPLDDGPDPLFPKGYQKKIFYNFFKIMMIDYENEEKDKLKILPFQYDHLTQKQKDKFISQINNIRGIEFRIRNIEKKSNGLVDKDFYVKIIKKNFVDIIYSALINEGILSKIVYNPKCIDKNELGKEGRQYLKRNMRKYVFTKEKIEEFNLCNYYLGNTSYEYIKIPNYELNRKFTIYEHLSEKKYGIDYYSQYALNWISQIFLYFKFINCRILYVTGATGVGKSTQVPKLLQYALKAFSYKIAGKVICTQPRIDPTEGVSTRVAEELSMPIQLTIDNVKVLEPSLNKFVQFKHAKNKIIDDYTDTYLKFVTDGTFFEQIKANPALKEEENLSFISNKESYFKIQNKYDVIAIDEAHEHNKNMDYILSIMRNSLYYNNDLKLVIISATMDDDEKVYRYYYRHIDDNLKYPLSSLVLEPLTLKPEERLTRFFIDRRVHIEPPPEPGQSSTKFPVKDIYLDFDTDYDMAEKESIKAVTKICNETSDGHILLFTTGVAEIQNLSKIFLKILPENVLIFPYFSAMPNAEKYKDDVQKIDTRISNYNVNRSSFVDFMFKVIKEDKIETGNFSYDRALIIATNVAEASITITNLKFVVDIGYYNFVGYDYNTALSSARKEKIDDNSRAQRRGRTGRTNAGTVYYMYKEGDRKKVTSIKSIEAENITFDILKLLSNDQNNESSFFEEEFDPYYCKLINKKIKKEELFNNFKNKKNYDKIIENQFLYEGDIISENNIDFRNRYLINNENNKEQIFEELKNTDFRVFYSFKETGFDPEILFDNYGMFFIVHPEERNIQRLNTFLIVRYREDENNNFIPWNTNIKEIKFKKLEKIYKQLENFFFIKKDVMNNPLYDYKKTFFIKYFDAIIGSELDFMVDKVTNSNELLTITYIISKMFNCSHEIIILNSLLKASSYNLRNLIYSVEKFNPKKSKMEKIFTINKYKINIDYSHQLIQLYNIGINILSKVLPILQNIFRKKSIYIDFKKFNKIDKSIIEKEINQNDISKIIIRYNKNKFSLSVKERRSLKKIIALSNEKEITIYKYLINTLNPIISDFFIDNKDLIDYISKDLEINKKILIEFIKNYINNVIVNNFDDKLKENLDELTSKVMFQQNKKNSILNCFYNSYKLNIETLSNDNKDMIKTDKGFINIGIEGNEKFFYLAKNQFPNNPITYSIINRVNFNIVDIKKETKALDS
jgi:hypothetical protein